MTSRSVKAYGAEDGELCQGGRQVISFHVVEPVSFLGTTRSTHRQGLVKVVVGRSIVQLIRLCMVLNRYLEEVG